MKLQFSTHVIFAIVGFATMQGYFGWNPQFVSGSTNPVSCQKKCFTQQNRSNPCYCDARCSRFRNCCYDFIPLCASVDSCQRRCEAKYNATNSCQCNKACTKYKNCCPDYQLECGKDNIYFCKGKCNVTLERCECKPGCEASKNCCSDYEETCLGAPAWVDEKCAEEKDMKCPDNFRIPPVILFSIDGFQAEYLNRNLTPNINKLASCGVHAPYMRSTYPTKTFPSHYTIATGLYPESHGIVDNRMYDYNRKEEFRLGRKESSHSFWWGGEPIWVTASNQGLKSATYFWPGSDVNITRYPDYYYKYNGGVDNEERIYQAFDWLDLPQEKRPTFMTLYVSILDSAGHRSGPDGQSTNDALTVVDSLIGILMNGLKLRGLENCVNLILLSDHGMAPVSCDRKSSVEDYGVNLDNVYFRGGTIGKIAKSKNPTLWPLFNARATHDSLRCRRNKTHWQSFLKYEYFPKRFHYAFNDRIQDVQLLMDDEWLVEGRKGSLTSCKGGSHGYDNQFKSMRALFTAHGPGFNRAFNMTEPFEGIEVYNLMAELMKLKPAPNNGTQGALHHIMKSPAGLADEPAGTIPATCSFQAAKFEDSGCSLCADTARRDTDKQLALSANETTALQRKHMPYGPPNVHLEKEAKLNNISSFCFLIQQDYVSAYDLVKKMPKLVSFTLTDDVMRDLAPFDDCRRHDKRIPSNATTSCSYEKSSYNVSYVYLYPPELSAGARKHDAAITSNIVPMYSYTETIWKYMSRVAAHWTRKYGGISVAAGPAFDYNYDGLPDTNKVLLTKGKFVSKAVPIPTHFYMIVTRCENAGKKIVDCNSGPQDVEVLSFIIPNYEFPPCDASEVTDFKWIPNTLIEHVARIKDVELLTGISFLSTWTTPSSSVNVRSAAIRKKIWLPQFTGQWLIDFLSTEPDSAPTTTPSTETTSVGCVKFPNHFVIVFLLSLLSFTQQVLWDTE